MKNGIKNMQAAAYNGARTVFIYKEQQTHFCLFVSKFFEILNSESVDSGFGISSDE